MKKSTIRLSGSLQKVVILFFTLAGSFSSSSSAQEINNIQMAIESAEVSIIAGKSRNSMVMIDSLKTSNELLLAEQETHPNKNIKDALRHIQSAISYAIGSRHNHSIREVEKALHILKQHQ